MKRRIARPVLGLTSSSSPPPPTKTEHASADDLLPLRRHHRQSSRHQRHGEQEQPRECQRHRRVVDDRTRDRNAHVRQPAAARAPASRRAPATNSTGQARDDATHGRPPNSRPPGHGQQLGQDAEQDRQEQRPQPAFADRRGRPQHALEVHEHRDHHHDQVHQVDLADAGRTRPAPKRLHPVRVRRTPVCARSRNNTRHPTSARTREAPAFRRLGRGSGRASTTLSVSHSQETSAETRAR